MIKEIIKRDGRIEAYVAGKLNRWAGWAAESLGDKVDWSGVVMRAASELPARVTSEELQQKLIDVAMEKRTWSYYVMAGRLYAAAIRKIIYGGDKPPTVLALHTKLQDIGLMRKLDYTDAEYFEIEQMIDHGRDFDVPHFALHHLRNKYAVMNRVEKKEFESQQFTYMRMAMTLSEKEDKAERLTHVRNFYNFLSLKKLSAPTPNFVNLGTHLESYASCCLYSVTDTGDSLAIGDYIANKMTQASAGIGSNLMTRSLGDPVRKGLIRHQGKLPYYRAKGKSVLANLQNGRGGAGTTFFSAFDPEAETILQLRNVRSTEDKKIRDLHYAMLHNPWFAQKIAKNEKIFQFNIFTAPDLHAKFYSADLKGFVELYQKYEADPNFKKVYVDSRTILGISGSEAYGTGTSYSANIYEMNKHTPFDTENFGPIYSSNLCMEICEPTTPYENMMDLYSTEDHGRGEIATCNLAAIIKENIRDDEEYAEVMYYALKMIDYCILNSKYAFPHLEFTAKARMNAGVGMMGFAVHMARLGLTYSSIEGKQESHRAAEKHMYFAIKASLRISKERGLAPWIHKTKWPKGWLPIDTYNRGVDEIGTFENQYDWEALRQEIIANGGLAHSVLVAYMPGEASSKAAGSANSIYPIRELELLKTDNGITTRWAAPYGDDPSYKYELAWDIDTLDMIDHYALWQKWTDQAISADEWEKVPEDTTVDMKRIRQVYLHKVKRGQKTSYYLNTQTSAKIDMEGNTKIVSEQTMGADEYCDTCAL